MWKTNIIGRSFLLQMFFHSCPLIRTASFHPHILMVISLNTCVIRIAATGLYEYASFFQSHSDMLLYYNPPFDRPILSFPPSREDFTFLPSTSPSDSFLYLPISKEEPRTPVKFQDDCKNMWSAPMSKPTIDKVSSLVWCTSFWWLLTDLWNKTIFIHFIIRLHHSSIDIGRFDAHE